MKKLWKSQTDTNVYLSLWLYLSQFWASTANIDVFMVVPLIGRE